MTYRPSPERLARIEAELDLAGGADRVFELVAQGNGVTYASKVLRIAYTDLWDWLESDEERKHKLTRARNLRAEGIVDQIGVVIPDVLAGRVDPNAGRVAIDGLKWLACKFYPRMYGDKVAVEHGGEVSLDLSKAVARIQELVRKASNGKS